MISQDPGPQGPEKNKKIKKIIRPQAFKLDRSQALGYTGILTNKG